MLGRGRLIPFPVLIFSALKDKWYLCCLVGLNIGSRRLKNAFCLADNKHIYILMIMNVDIKTVRLLDDLNISTRLVFVLLIIIIGMRLQLILMRINNRRRYCLAVNDHRSEAAICHNESKHRLGFALMRIT